VQVFYRDESQGILLGAVRAKGTTDWKYELVDGDRKTDERTTGDVAFHLDALFDGKETILIYDSVLTRNQRQEPTSGAVRIARRSGFSPSSWKYKGLDASGGPIAGVGYDVALQKGARGVLATWLTSSTLSLPNADQIRWAYLSSPTDFKTLATTGFGTPSKFISSDGSTTVFNCQGRLCAIDVSKGTITLVTKETNADGFDSAWIVLDKRRYLVSGVGSQLVLLRSL
jgi:hypothetical protein